MYKKFISVICLLLVLVNIVTALDAYPEWFLQQGKFPEIVVGFSYNGASPKIDAARMFCAYSECIVDGKLELYQNWDLKNSEYYYYFSAELMEQVKDQLYEIDSFVNNILTEDVISAFSLDSTYQISSKYLALDTLKRPGWTNKIFWEENGYYFGVGIYTSRANKNDAWKTAEERAVFAIMNNLAVEYHQLTISQRSESGSTLEKARALKLKYKLKNIQPQERWADREEMMFYVLVKIKKSDVIPLYRIK